MWGKLVGQWRDARNYRRVTRQEWRLRQFEAKAKEARRLKTAPSQSARGDLMPDRPIRST